MLMPSIFENNLFDTFDNFDNWMNFSFPDVNRKLYGRRADHLMRTDVKETADAYEVAIDLPGFKKDEINAEIKDGYLIINASKEHTEENPKDAEGKSKETTDRYIRRERYVGSMSRSFYIGENVTENDIRAGFENGILTLNIPKKVEKKPEEKHFVAIEG